jgi:hypothetical protein
VKKELAVFTMVRNEKVFLPMWLRYYGKATPYLYVLDHESDDGSVDPACSPVPFINLPVTNATTDDAEWMRGVVERFFRTSLYTFDTVIYAEADELLVPRHGTLAEFIGNRPQSEHLTATGFDVCDPGGQPPLSAVSQPGWDRGPHPLFGRLWKRNDRYDKTLIGRIPMTWEVGFHRPTNVKHPSPDPELVLLHLHYACRETAWDRLRARMRTKQPSPGDLGFQNKYRDREQFDANFNEATSGSEWMIPEWVIDALYVR